MAEEVSQPMVWGNMTVNILRIVTAHYRKFQNHKNHR